MQSFRSLLRKSIRIYFTPLLFYVIFSTKYVRIFVSYYLFIGLEFPIVIQLAYFNIHPFWLKSTMGPIIKIAFDFILFFGSLLLRLHSYTIALYAFFVFGQIVRAKIEEKKLESAFPDYAAYKKRAGMFFPKIVRRH